MTTKNQPSDQQLASTLNDVLLELEHFWNVPSDCPTFRRLAMVQRALVERDESGLEFLDDLLLKIRSKRST